MRFILSIRGSDIHWSDFKQLIESNSNSENILKACYIKSSRRRGLGFSRKS